MARVAQVQDGDTLKLTDGRRVRLIGVNTPELARAGRPDEPQAHAARAWLRAQLDARPVRLLPGREAHDRYGRLLAHLYLADQRLAAQALIAQGLGYALAVGANDRLAPCLFAAEAEARRQRLGIWQQAPLAAAAIDRAGFAVVRGRVTGMTVLRRGRYVDLDRHLALWLPAGALAEAAAGWRPGQWVEARGWVVDRRQRPQSVPSGQPRWLLEVAHRYHVRAD